VHEVCEHGHARHEAAREAETAGHLVVVDLVLGGDGIVVGDNCVHAHTIARVTRPNMATAEAPPLQRAEPTPTPATQAPRPRLPGLDRLRAAALLLMLMHHLTGWFVGSPRRYLPGWPGFVITDVAAPAFVVAAGASAHLLVQSRRRRSIPWARLHTLVLRRYGLLIPIGVLLRLVAFNDLMDWGVLECLGVAVLVAYAAGRALPGRRLAGLAAVLLVVAPLVERAGRGLGGLPTEILAGTFPVVLYTGFALAGYAGARALGERDRPMPALLLGAALAMVTAVLLVLGHPPHRYPGDMLFVIPGLSATLLLYGVLSAWQPGPRSNADGVLRAAGAHTLGIFLAHYGLYVVLKRAGDLDRFSPGPGIALGLAVALAFALVAPHVPTLPWSPRTGWHQRGPLATSSSTR
jgi:peptidoglycan/LPS O-acetylase OafA/YrhL